MKNLILSSVTGAPSTAKATEPIYYLTITTGNGQDISLEQYKGKHLLLVNIASKCGFTPQLTELEELSKQYVDTLQIIGFPANDFLGQEPGTDAEIATFCSLTYPVTFPVAKKASVIGKEQQPVFHWLSDKKLNGWNSTEPQWNFQKYLIDPKGELIAVATPKTSPLHKALTDLIR